MRPHTIRSLTELRFSLLARGVVSVDVNTRMFLCASETVAPEAQMRREIAASLNAERGHRTHGLLEIAASLNAERSPRVD